MKLKIAILTIALLGLFLVGCETYETDTIATTTAIYHVEDFIDPETGVHYLIYDEGYSGGITVRYNADGSIMVKDIKTESEE